MCDLFAYIDLSTGSLLIQLLAMAFMSVMIFFTQVKVFILGLFGIRKKDVSIELESADTEAESMPTVKLEQVAESADERKKAA